MDCWFCKRSHFKARLAFWSKDRTVKAPIVEYIWHCGERFVVGKGFTYTCCNAEKHNAETLKLLRD